MHAAATPAYNNTFKLEKGGGPSNSLEPGANGGAQRPNLLFDSQTGRPTHLYVAASCGGGRHVWSTQGYANCRPGQYTMVVPLATESANETMALVHCYMCQPHITVHCIHCNCPGKFLYVQAVRL